MDNVFSINLPSKCVERPGQNGVGSRQRLVGEAFFDAHFSESGLLNRFDRSGNEWHRDWSVSRLEACGLYSRPFTTQGVCHDENDDFEVWLD